MNTNLRWKQDLQKILQCLSGSRKTLSLRPEASQSFEKVVPLMQAREMLKVDIQLIF